MSAWIVTLRMCCVPALTLALLCLFGLCPDSALAALRRADQPFQERAPEFPWPSFQRFWNARCLPGCEIREPQYVDGRYVVQYGYSVNLVVRMERDVVRSVAVQFTNPEGSHGGGQRWLKLVDSVIGIGVYRWPERYIEEVRERFMEISQQAAEYKRQSSWFRRSYNPSTGWEFTLDFLPYAATGEE